MSQNAALEAQSYQGIIIKKTPYRDTDLILGLFTKEVGKVSVFVPGARKSIKRFGPYLDFFAEISMMVQVQSKKALWRLKETDLISSHMELRKNLSVLGFATYYADCLWNLLADLDPHPHIYEHFQKVLNFEVTPSNRFQSMFEFESKLLEMTGYELKFQTCMTCNTPTQSSMFFSYPQGSVLCMSCKVREPGHHISGQTWGCMQKQCDWDLSSYVEIREVMSGFVEYTLGKSLKSHGFRKSINA